MKTFMTMVLTALATLGVTYALYVNGYIQITGGNIAIQIGGKENKIEQNTDPSETVISPSQPSNTPKNKPQEQVKQAEDQKPAETTEVKPNPVSPQSPPKTETVREVLDNHATLSTQNYRTSGRRYSPRNRRWKGYSTYPTNAEYYDSSNDDCTCPSVTTGAWELVGEPVQTVERAGNTTITRTRQQYRIRIQ